IGFTGDNVARRLEPEDLMYRSLKNVGFPASIDDLYTAQVGMISEGVRSLIPRREDFQPMLDESDCGRGLSEVFQTEPNHRRDRLFVVFIQSEFLVFIRSEFVEDTHAL